MKGIVTFFGGILATVAVALGVFYGAFFKLAPYIQSCIPAGEWKKLADVVVYIVIAWAGGIGIPLTILIFGVITSIGLAGAVSD